MIQPTTHNQGADAAVTGVVEFDVRDLDSHRGGLAGLTVRVRLGSERWPTVAQLTRIAQVTWDAAQVEVVGGDSHAVVDAVNFVRERRAQYRRVEADMRAETAAWAARRGIR